MFLKKFGLWIAAAISSLGGTGLLVAAFADSSFIPLPEGVDLLLIKLSVDRPERMPMYVALATVGSMAGCAALYCLSRWGERKFMEGKESPKFARVQRWVEEYEFRALALGAMMPPPMPLKLLVIAAGMARGHFLKVMIALAIGRAFRYGGEGFLAVRYGRQAWQILLHAGPYVLLGVVLAIGLYFIIRRRGNAARDITNEA